MDIKLKQDVMLQRLCSEIQLFDLCDLTSCRFRSGRYCCNPELLQRFEKIADEELRLPERYVYEELDDGTETDCDDFYDYDCESEGDGDWEDE